MVRSDMAVIRSVNNEYRAKIAGRRCVFWIIFIIGIIVPGIIIFLLRNFAGGPQFPDDQILKGAPQFVVLSLVVVFAAYLRQVSVAAMEQRNKLLAGGLWNYPTDRNYDYVVDKARALDKTIYGLSLAAPFLII